MSGHVASSPKIQSVVADATTQWYVKLGAPGLNRAEIRTSRGARVP